jgi:hypothetical protein
MQGELDRLAVLRENPRFKIPVPTYSKKTATGAVQTFPHDETTLETDDDRKVWRDYVAARNGADAEYAKMWAKSIIVNGIAPAAPEDLEVWKRKQAFIGKPLPDDPLELHFEWVMSEVVGSPSDFDAISIRIMEISGVPEELVRDTEASFRGQVERDTPEGPADVPTIPGGQLDVQPEVRAGEGGHSKRRARDKQI